tara:strand:+ start:123 stop:458 length:336 start_codon:yes stop_codon:yes gene_type:complete
MKRTYRQDETGKFVEVSRERDIGVFIRDDIDPYVSPIDGSVISSRSVERQHNFRHGVSNDMDSLREKTQRRNEKPAETSQDRHERKLAIKDAIERVSSSGFSRKEQYENSR